MSDVIELPELSISLDEDEEEERRRRRRAAGDPLADLGSDVASAVGEEMEAAQTQALEQMRAPVQTQVPGDRVEPPRGRPSATPQGYLEAARQVAPSEVGLGRPGERPATAATPFGKTPGLDAQGAPVPAAAAPTPSRSTPAMAARSAPGPTISGTDKDLEAALAERDSRTTRNKVVDAIALLFGGGSSKVTQAVGGRGDANQPLEDLRLRRGEEARRNAEAAQQTERANARRTAEEEARYQAESRDRNSDVSRQAQDLLLALPTGLPEEAIRGLSAEQIHKSQLGPYIIAAQGSGNRRTERGDEHDWRDSDREDAQQHQLQRDAALNEVRLQIAQLRRRPGGGGGGGGGGQNISTLRSLIARSSEATGMPRVDAEALANALPAREVIRRASGLQGALASSAVRGDAVAERAALTRVSQYHRRLDDSGLVQAETQLGEIERAMQGATDRDVQTAIAAMNGGETALAALSEANPRAARIAQAVTGLQNVQLRQQSGAAVSAQEFTRFRTQLGSGSMMSAAPLRNGIASVRRGLAADRANVDAGFPDVIEYERTGQMPPRGPILAPPSGGGQPAGTVRMRARNGRVYPVPEAQVQAALADGAVRVDG